MSNVHVEPPQSAPSINKDQVQIDPRHKQINGTKTKESWDHRSDKNLETLHQVSNPINTNSLYDTHCKLQNTS